MVGLCLLHRVLVSRALRRHCDPFFTNKEDIVQRSWVIFFQARQ